MTFNETIPFMNHRHYRNARMFIHSDLCLSSLLSYLHLLNVIDGKGKKEEQKVSTHEHLFCPLMDWE